MKKTAIRIVVLLILQSLWLETSQAADPGGAKFNEELSKQEQIYQSRGEKVPEGYITGRSLLSYTLILSSEFDRALAILEPKDRWLDIGAGAGRAVLDYYSSRYDLMHLEGWERRSTKARAVAISIEDRRTPCGRKTPQSSAQTKYNICLADACGSIRQRNWDDFRSLPTYWVVSRNRSTLLCLWRRSWLLWK